MTQNHGGVQSTNRGEEDGAAEATGGMLSSEKSEPEPKDPAARSEQALVQGLRAGNSEALTLLIHRFGAQLQRLVSRLTSGSSECDDLVQETLLTAWRQAGSFRGEGSLEGWLRRIAVNRCRSHMRRKEALRRVWQTFAMQRAGRLNASNPTSRNEPLERLQEALARIGSQDREVIVLFYLEQLSGEEVAEALNTSVAAVHMRLKRARERLRKLLEAKQQ
ncbi:MAG: sigma-70 family RNA polymerase sigma factor [Planctomycetales bacterium]|nr:sigma-70 family RNA polymerase sigma factor [Planctomycetales bacterium]